MLICIRGFLRKQDISYIYLYLYISIYILYLSIYPRSLYLYLYIRSNRCFELNLTPPKVAFVKNLENFNFANCKYLAGGGSIGKCLGFSAKWSLTGKLQIFRAICATEENRRIASNIRIRPKAVFAFSQPREQIANLRFFNSNASNFHPSTSRCSLEADVENWG